MRVRPKLKAGDSIQASPGWQGINASCHAIISRAWSLDQALQNETGHPNGVLTAVPNTHWARYYIPTPYFSSLKAVYIQAWESEENDMNEGHGPSEFASWDSLRGNL